jgi:hypothetical protein
MYCLNREPSILLKFTKNGFYHLKALGGVVRIESMKNHIPGPFSLLQITLGFELLQPIFFEIVRIDAFAT